MKKNSIKLKNNKKAFSLVEVLISVFVLAVGILAVVQLISLNLSQSMDSRNHIVATGLALEGIEVVRNLKDNNLAKGEDDYAKNINNTTSGRIDYDDAKVAVDGKYQLLLNNNIYSYNSGGAKTKFFRRIIINDYDKDGVNGKKVVSIVSWNGKDVPDNTGNCDVAHKCVYAESVFTESY